MSLKIVFLGIMPEGAVEPVPLRLLNDSGYPFPHVALYATTTVLIVRRPCTAEDSFAAILERRRLGIAIAAMIRMVRMTTKKVDQ